MKIITLNTWGGRIHQPLFDFLKKNEDIDVFCLQEIYSGATRPLVEDKGDRFNLFTEIQEILTGHTGYFKPAVEGWGLAIFIKKSFQVLKEGDYPIYEVPNYTGGANNPRNLQYISFLDNAKNYTVFTVHGLWNGQGKSDSEDRIKQSIEIKKYVDSAEGNKILCGDFNLLPDTKSVAILEEGMKNLIKEYGVTNTRTGFYTKPEKFADYIFISPDIEINEFKVLPDQVSDHTPLFLEI